MGTAEDVKIVLKENKELSINGQVIKVFAGVPSNVPEAFTLMLGDNGIPFFEVIKKKSAPAKSKVKTAADQLRTKPVRKKAGNKIICSKCGTPKDKTEFRERKFCKTCERLVNHERYVAKTKKK